MLLAKEITVADLDEATLKEFVRKGLYVIPDKMTASYLTRFNFKPDILIDVGVSHGSDFLYELFPATKTLLVDPLPGFQEIVSSRFPDRNFEYFQCGVGSAPGTAQLKIQSDNASKSTFGEPTRMQGRNTGEVVDVEIRTVDDIAAEYAGTVGLKIDTEGHELEVLKGSVETLKRCEFVLAEVSVKKRYENGYRFSDIVLFMRDNGFEIIDMLNPIWRVHMFWDCLFVRADSNLFSERAI